MNKLIRATQTIEGNEKAWGLFEIHEQAPDNSGFHRYQIIQVIRDNQISEFRKDMGRVKGRWTHVRQLRIPSFLEHTVDELMYLADDLRQDNTAKDNADILELLGIVG